VHRPTPSVIDAERGRREGLANMQALGGLHAVRDGVDAAAPHL
jgi:hypothetical protein